MDWYCVRSRPKSEHLAAAHLQKRDGIEVFCPRVKFEKATRRGKIWFVEALFPGYFFARFDLDTQLRMVKAATAVSGVIHFADAYPALSPDLITELRREFDGEEPRKLESEIREGDEVLITEGALRGLTVLVTRALPGRERVRILLNWLGQEREAEVKLRSVARPGNFRGGA